MRLIRPFRSPLPLLAIVALVACGGRYGKPEDPAAQLAFGVQMAQRGLWSEALFRFRQSERQDPDNSRIVNNIAVALEATGNYDEALEYYQKALRTDPGNADLKRNYARFSEFYATFRQPAAEAEPGGEPGPDDSESPPGDG